jgi:putative transposase
MSEEESRKEAVRRRLAGESPSEIAEGLGRTTRWVRKWVARHSEEGHEDTWAEGHSRAPYTSPWQISDETRNQILTARGRLVANPRAQYGSLAIQWELHRLGVEPIPPSRTIERVISRAGLTRRRQRQPKYVSKGVPYPSPVGVEVGTTHQIDMIGPRHLFGADQFHALNLIDVGSHLVGNDIVTELRPPLLAVSLAGIWSVVGIPKVAQFDNHANFRGGIQPAYQHFGPIVATCLDLGVTPRFIPVREPWRNGVIEHFNDVWDKSFFRTETFTSLDHLRAENTTFIEFHNAHHRYSAHGGQTPDHMWQDQPQKPLSTDYRPPTRLPAQGQIEVVRYIRSDRHVDLFGKRITVAEDQTHQYVTAIIKVRSKQVVVVTLDGEIIHNSDYQISRILR